jgi:hypothetical protein
MFFSKPRQAIHLEFDKSKDQTGLTVLYDEFADESASLTVYGTALPLSISFDPSRIDEAHILYMEVTEILYSRANAGESAAAIEAVLRQLITKYQK